MDRVWMDLGVGVTIETPRPREEAEIVDFLIRASHDEVITKNAFLPPNISLEEASKIYHRYNVINLLFVIRLFGELAGIFHCDKPHEETLKAAHLETENVVETESWIVSKFRGRGVINRVREALIPILQERGTAYVGVVGSENNSAKRMLAKSGHFRYLKTFDWVDKRNVPEGQKKGARSSDIFIWKFNNSKL